MKGLLIIMLFTLFTGAIGDAAEKETLVAKDNGFWKLVPKDAKLEKVAKELAFTEGPVWHKDGYLLFSDCHANGIMKYDPSTGKTSLYRAVEGFSNGMTFDTQGRLTAVEYGMHRITRQEKDGSITPLVSQYEGKRLNSTNDLVVKSDGSIYFTDPPYGVKAEDRELDFCAVYRLSPDGKLTLLTRDMDAPNGLAFSPDEKLLYVADSSRHSNIQTFDVKPDGTLTNMRLFAVLRDSTARGVPDGLKVDKDGNVWSTGPGGVWVFDKSGKHLGTIRTPEVSTNCAWGDPDGKTLYITTTTSVCRIKTSSTGIRPWIR